MKKFIKFGFILIGAVLILFLLAAVDLYYLPINHTKLDPIERYTVKQIVTRWQNNFNQMSKEKQRLITYEDFFNGLNFFEKKYASRIFAIKPDVLGFKGPFFSKDPVQDIVTIPATIIKATSTDVDTGINYLPKNVYADYQKMNEAIKKEINKNLYINSGYRSPGYQAYLFFYYLHSENGYSLNENAKWIAMPGYSEHNSANTAVDFINQDGISGEEKGQTSADFEKLAEYSWLQKNANKFNFYLSYPQNNQFGVSYEPWHWHWEKK